MNSLHLLLQQFSPGLQQFDPSLQGFQNRTDLAVSSGLLRPLWCSCWCMNRLEYIGDTTRLVGPMPRSEWVSTLGVARVLPPSSLSFFWCMSWSANHDNRSAYVSGWMTFSPNSFRITAFSLSRSSVNWIRSWIFSSVAQSIRDVFLGRPDGCKSTKQATTAVISYSNSTTPTSLRVTCPKFICT